MQHLTLDAKAQTRTDQGELVMLVATYERDRSGDVIQPGAFRDTIARWRKSGRTIPVHYNHSAAAADIIGAADPETMRESPKGLIVEAKLDIELSERAREVWRSVKSGALACSFGYVADDGEPLEGGGRLLTKLDLYEVTLTPAPMNDQTRVVSYKGTVRSEPTTEQVAEILAIADAAEEKAANPVRRLATFATS